MIATAPPSQRTAFYELTSGGKIRLAPPIDLSDRLPARGLLSTAGDLALFGATLVDGTLVKPSSAKAMFTSQKTVDGGTAVLLIHPHSPTVLALTTNEATPPQSPRRRRAKACPTHRRSPYLHQALDPRTTRHARA